IDFSPIPIMDRIRHHVSKPLEVLLSDDSDKEAESLFGAYADPDRVLALMVFARLDLLAATCGAAMCGGIALLLATYVLLVWGAPAGGPIGPNLPGSSTCLPRDYLSVCVG